MVSGMRSVPEKIFAMNRVATPLLSLGSGQACPEQFALLLMTTLFITRYPSTLAWVDFAVRSGSPACGLGDRLGTATTKSRLVLHSAPDSPWHLPRRVVRALACSRVFGNVLISVPGIGCPESRSSGCAGSGRAARVTGSGG